MPTVPDRPLSPGEILEHQRQLLRKPPISRYVPGAGDFAADFEPHGIVKIVKPGRKQD